MGTGKRATAHPAVSKCLELPKAAFGSLRRIRTLFRCAQTCSGSSRRFRAKPESANNCLNLSNSAQSCPRAPATVVRRFRRYRGAVETCWMSGCSFV
eukprot:671977-Alexandrium_andersonii.AAC.1